MNIIKAIKSGKLFKRRKWDKYCYVTFLGKIKFKDEKYGDHQFYLDFEDLMTEDWETEN